MFDIGFLELFIVATIALIVLGPEKLPTAARSLGLMIGKFRRTINGIQDDIERQARLDELKKKLDDPESIFEDDASQNTSDSYDDEQEAQQDLDNQLTPVIDLDMDSQTNKTESPIKPEKINKQKITIQPTNPSAHD